MQLLSIAAAFGLYTTAACYPVNGNWSAPDQLQQQQQQQQQHHLAECFNLNLDTFTLFSLPLLFKEHVLAIHPESPDRWRKEIIGYDVDAVQYDTVYDRPHAYNGRLIKENGVFVSLYTDNLESAADVSEVADRLLDVVEQCGVKGGRIEVQQRGSEGHMFIEVVRRRAATSVPQCFNKTLETFSLSVMPHLFEERVFKMWPNFVKVWKQTTVGYVKEDVKFDTLGKHGLPHPYNGRLVSYGGIYVSLFMDGDLPSTALAGEVINRMHKIMKTCHNRGGRDEVGHHGSKGKMILEIADKWNPKVALSKR